MPLGKNNPKFYFQRIENKIAALLKITYLEWIAILEFLVLLNSKCRFIVPISMFFFTTTNRHLSIFSSKVLETANMSI